MPPPFRRFHNGSQHRQHIDYIPSPSSGAYVILVGMLKAKQFDMLENLTKQQILDHGKKYTESGPREDGKIWPAINSLLNRSLVSRNMPTRVPLYTLTQQGEDLAKKLLATTAELGVDEDSQDAIGDDESSRGLGELRSQLAGEASNSCSSYNVQINRDSSFELKAGTFDIILIIDQREKIDLQTLDSEIRKEVRSLACGDYIWVARPRGLAPNDRTKDLVLDYVIERKRLDDLQQSMFSGRLEEQKLRLLNLGVRRPMYLIEDHGQLRTNRLTSTDLSRAVTGILVRDGIEIEKVKNAQHANDYLSGMTKCLQRYFSSRDLKSCDQERLKSGLAEPHEYLTYAEFQARGPKIKNFTVREMFAKHLVQITGMSGARAAVICREYPTISTLVEAYDKCLCDKEKENLLSKLQVPNSTKIGPALSKRVYAAYAMAAHWDLDDRHEDLVGQAQIGYYDDDIEQLD